MVERCEPLVAKPEFDPVGKLRDRFGFSPPNDSIVIDRRPVPVTGSGISTGFVCRGSGSRKNAGVSSLGVAICPEAGKDARQRLNSSRICGWRTRIFQAAVLAVTLSFVASAGPLIKRSLYSSRLTSTLSLMRRPEESATIFITGLITEVGLFLRTRAIEPSFRLTRLPAG